MYFAPCFCATFVSLFSTLIRWIHRFSKEIRAAFVNHMDFPTLLAFRATSKDNLCEVQKEITASFQEVLRTAVPDSATFGDMLVHHNGFLVGYAPLRFFLRLPPDYDIGLEVYVPYDSFTEVIVHMLCMQEAAIIIDGQGFPYNRSGRYCHLQTSAGTVTIIGVRESSAVIAACTTTSTAVAAYANPVHFGMMWPTLTFDGRALASGICRSSPEDDMYHAQALGIDVKLWAWCWPDLGLRPQACAADRFMCPHQLRHSNDKGTMHVTIDPLRYERLESNILFRHDTRPCRGRCLTERPDIRDIYDCTGPQEGSRRAIGDVGDDA